MSSPSPSRTLGGPSRCGRVLGPSLDKLIKSAAWRKHTNIVSSAKSALEKLETITDFTPPTNTSSNSPLLSLSNADAEFVLNPLVLALESGYGKLIEPTLDCLGKLFGLGLFRGEIGKGSLILRIIDGVCKCGIGDEGLELSVLRVLLSAVRSEGVLLRGDCLVGIVRTCYNVYLGGVNVTNQICAKAVLAQIMGIVFARVEADCVDVGVKVVNVGELFEFTDKGLNEPGTIVFVQGFVNDVVGPGDGGGVGGGDVVVRPWLEKWGGEKDGGEGEGEETIEGGESKIREDGILLFKNLCKLSMKFSSQEDPDDQILLRGKTLSLELLKVVMDNAGPVWRTNDKFLNAIKQYLCLSLLKNSALSVMTIFQLQCAIFMLLLAKLRSGLKEEIGIFFPMLVLRVVENVLQPSFVQKMTVLNLLEKISQDSQIMIDIFVNYDCDVDSPNIFERTVNGLLKTALGPPSGSTTTLSPVQDITFRHESVKCLVSIIKSMGTWMYQQLRIGDSHQSKRTETDNLTENLVANGEEGTTPDADLHSEGNSEVSDAASLEQRRAYKLELQKGISLFNRKPSKGIDFLMSTKKIDGSPEAVASFLRNTAGLNGTMIGDYLGEREDFALKVMHAYVDSYNFIEMDFGEAIRFFLQGFRLPGEAQKIDRIMEKFAERYCKCNPNSFRSADTAYVLAYSVILLNTDAHNNMVKDKMTKADFIRNNRGIDDGKDLPEEYLGAIYDQIVKNEIKMHADFSAAQNKQASGFNKLLGFDGILNLVTGKQSEEKALGANGLLIRQIQEKFKAKSGKSESVYHAVADVAILRFMVEVCWGPMLAAFSVTLDQSDDRLAASQCLQGFRYSVHVTAVMGMQTQRDAFVTSVAKFTYLHCAADMKQKNVDAVKAIISIAIEDGNFLQEAWEHILTCLSRIEHLQLLGEGAPTDASILTSSNVDSEDKKDKSVSLSSKKRGNLQNNAMMAVVRGGSYESATLGANTSGLVSQEQISNFISNLYLLDQIGTFELNHVFGHSQRLNSEAIVAFVKALCKVAISELQSPTDPRVFSLTKLVEIAHYNMSRIRLVWSRIWSVLSDFFVSVGLSDNLSVSIFVMDSLRQLAAKFLEREELANYNFQNEFLRPFVIVMQKSNSAEIRELIVRCISQMVLTRVSNVKSGWKSVFMVFTAAATDEQKNIVVLAFETMEKIVREYFPYITETETVTFTDCVKCLIAFTNSKFNSDVSLTAIAFLRFCAVKLADGGLVSDGKSVVGDSCIPAPTDSVSNAQTVSEKDDRASYWVPLLTGLSKLTFDRRSAIRKTSLEVLFNILKDHGHLFSTSFWFTIFDSIVFPIFSGDYNIREMHSSDNENLPTSKMPHPEGSSWDSETFTVATECLVNLFISFFDVLRSLLPGVVSILTVLTRNPVLMYVNTGLNALLHLTSELEKRLTEDEWRNIFFSLKDAILSSHPVFIRVLKTIDDVDVPKNFDAHTNTELAYDNKYGYDDMEDDHMQSAAYAVSRIRSHISVQLLVMQVLADLYGLHQKLLSTANVNVMLEIFLAIVSHAHQLCSETVLLKKLQRVCSILEIADPPIVSFEIDCYKIHLSFLQDILGLNPTMSKEMNLESQLVDLCENILQMYLNCTRTGSALQKTVNQPVHYMLPMSSEKKEELSIRSKLVVSALQALSGLDRNSFREHVSRIFPLLVELVRTEHSSREVQLILSRVFQSCIGPLIFCDRLEI